MRTGDRLRTGVAGACAAVLLVLPQAAAAEVVTQSFTVAGEHAFVVPPAVTSLQVTLVGGYGGPGRGGTPGGTPATTNATFVVSPGETLYVEVAGNGESAEGLQDNGGYGGGGHGGIRVFVFSSSPGGGGGGGASDIRTCPTASECGGHSSLLSRLLVAAGGGGGGGYGLNPGSTAGGVGGSADQSGNAGAHDAATDAGGSGGARASASAAGTAGGPSGGCSPPSTEGCSTGGELGNGGIGGDSVSGGGGGGGGGIFGGGGGGAGALSNVGTQSSPVFANGGGGGGGGGSSGVLAGATGISGFSLVPTAEAAVPSATLSWSAPAPTVLTEAASTLTPTTATLNGTVNPNTWQPTGCSFIISPAPAGISSFPCAQQLTIGGTPIPVSATASGLAPGTTYTLALTASTVQGSASGARVSFTTPTPTRYEPSGPLSIGAVTLSPTTFRRGKHAATLAKAKAKRKTVPTATTISFTLSEAATATLSLERSSPGVISGHKCITKSKTHRTGRSCTRYALVHGDVTRSAHAGLDKIHFEGILDANKPLPAGAYRLSLKASDQAGSVTAAQHPSFKLLV